MKTTAIYYPALGLFIAFFFFCCFVTPPQQVQAQDSDYAEPSEKYSREQLAQMLAPIALYPDALLSKVLMASTYPIEVVEADRWIRKNPSLKGEALDTSLLNKKWDPSVKAICHFPSILALMSERITETTNIGNAFLAQETEVMDMVQELRAKAHAKNNLTTTAKQKVIVENETIIIEPANPRVIYVPYYDPLYIYGPWWYPAYPPYYWGPPRLSIGSGVSYWPGIYFAFSFGTWSYFDWHNHYIHIDARKRPRFIRHNRWITKPARWHHVPRHRRGVAYPYKSTARKYGQSPHRSSDIRIRRDTRGFPEQRDRDRRGTGQTRIDRNKRMNSRIKIDRDRRERVRIERAQRQRSRGNVFNRVENGRKDRRSSERGRISRQGQRSDSRGRSRWRGDSMRGRGR